MFQQIILKNVRIFAYHGVEADERKLGTYYCINLSVDVDFTNAMVSDTLSDTVNYADVYAVLQDVMSQSQKLLEHVAYKISATLFQKFSEIQAIHLSLLKESPPVSNSDCDGCGVELSISRNEYLSLRQKH